MLLDDNAILAAQEICGFFDFQNIYGNIVHTMPNGAKLVEVGVYKGRSLIYLAQQAQMADKVFEIYAVDHWLHDWQVNEFLANCIAARVNHMIKAIRCPSHIAPMNFPAKDVDFVYIDADHRYEHVKRDIEAWLPCIKPGGILAGHDFHLSEVRKAVYEVFDKRSIELWSPHSWVYRRPLDS